MLAARLRKWSSARSATDKSEWSADQWPADVRRAAEELVIALKAQCHAPPVLYYSEWVDLWSMGDVIQRALRVNASDEIATVYTSRFEIYGYPLPDEGRLIKRLKSLRRQTHQEYAWYRARLIEAVEAWSPLVQQSSILVIREIVDGLVTDDELLESLEKIPPWLD